VPEQEQSRRDRPRRQRSFWFVVVLLVGGAGGGAVFAGALTSFVQYTNTMDFCISCHTMEATVYQELQKTPHWNNPSGVRAICSDCHVPHGNWIETLWFKTKATKELYLTITGQVNTVEELEAGRLEMAQSVWDHMKRTDSHECRSCHVWDAMVLAEQRPRARGQHQSAVEEGETCIDCHKGIAHKDVSEELEQPTEEGEQDFTF
jgi:nitrate/TMAO reductase-like tetraheme cytochrome c subunit